MAGQKMKDKDPLTSTNYEDYWDSPESVVEYSTKRFLLRGERLALASCFPDGFAGRRVLDLACGAGRTTYFLHEMGTDVVGVDISRNLIRAAQERFPDIDFRVGDAASLEFDNASFEAVLFSFNSLDCLYPKDKRLTSIREIWRVLRPGGAVHLFTPQFRGVIFWMVQISKADKIIVSRQAYPQRKRLQE